jgi:Lon protease-like protein
MSEESAIQVNFGKPVPLFPLDTPILLPQQVIPLRVFEPRYKQMVAEVLDGTGQIAMAVFAGGAWKQEYHGKPPLRPAVCIGQIVQHEREENGTYMLLVQGVCRARIAEEIKPGQGRLYREAMLEPVGIDMAEETKLYGVRERLSELLEARPLSELQLADRVVELIQKEQIPTAVLLELVAFALPTRAETRYRLLEEADAAERADLIEHELLGLKHLMKVAKGQHPEEWPKGISWN